MTLIPFSLLIEFNRILALTTSVIELPRACLSTFMLVSTVDGDVRIAVNKSITLSSFSPRLLLL